GLALRRAPAWRAPGHRRDRFRHRLEFPLRLATVRAVRPGRSAPAFRQRGETSADPRRPRPGTGAMAATGRAGATVAGAVRGGQPRVSAVPARRWARLAHTAGRRRAGVPGEAGRTHRCLVSRWLRASEEPADVAAGTVRPDGAAVRARHHL